jgi:3-oxoacyl-[acyl-carrier-protein] synthase II
MSATRIVVTGIGAISPLALNAPRHFERLLAGDSAVEKLADVSYSNYPPMLQAAVRDFDRREFVPDRMLRKLLSPSPAYALGAATEAMRDAGVLGSDVTECGLYVGSVCLDADPEAFIPALRECIDPTDNVDLGRFATHGMKLVDPLFLVKSLPNAGLCGIAIQHQVLGPNANITNGAVSGLQAVIAAIDAMRRGEAEMALAGGYDSLLRMDTIVDHLLAGRLAPERVSPFDRARAGYALSEGASFVMLETLEHARRRNATIYAELFTTGQSAYPMNLIAPTPDDDGLVSCARQALDATDPATIDLILGDGLAYAIDDDRELAACRTVFPDSNVAFSSYTASFGFPGAAAGTFSLVHAMQSIRQGVLPPTINCDDPLTSDVDVVRHARPAQPRRVLVWTSDRGIKNAAVLAGALEN